MGALRKTMEYLGLSEPEQVEEVDYVVADDSYTYGEEVAVAEHGYSEHAEPMDRPAPVTPISAARSASADLRRIITVHPRTYNDAKVIGEAFRAGTPVIVNLSDMSDADAKRLVDFSAGLVFGLHGTIERVTNKVFLLGPASVEVSSDPRADGPARLFNQS